MQKVIFLKLILCILFIALTYSICRSQNIVVSEYPNLRNDPTGEWVELLVIEDNSDLRGFILRDNSGSSPPPVNWRGGVRFRNIPYWQGLRSGSIIVVNFRGNIIVDSSKSDGYIELGAENDYFFEKVCYYCPQGWSINALNIAEASDIVQILDNNDAHIHCLAHMPSEGGDFVNIEGGKLSASSSMTNATSVSVVPGESIDDFIGGFDATGSKTYISPVVTKGLPNNAIGKENLNQKFWKYLRQPKWSNPRIINYRIDSEIVTLEWSSAEDLLPSDSLTGYLLVRFLERDSANALSPIDGKVYNTNDRLGSAEVIANIHKRRFLDNYELQCDENNIYRIYAYRFNSDDLGFDSNPFNRRGRIYNTTNYAQIKLSKDKIEKVQIAIESENNVLCIGDSIKIIVKDSIYENYSYIWLRDGAIIKSNTNYLIVKEAGKYNLRVVSGQGCEAISNDIEITTKEKPISELSIDGKIIKSDTIIHICSNEKINLKVSKARYYEWFRNSEFINIASDSLVIDMEGEYFCIVYDDFCSNKTISVRIIHNKIDFLTDKDTIHFNFSEGINYIDTTIGIINNGTDDLYILKADIRLPKNITIISPIDSLIIIPFKSQKVLLIRCEANFSGIAIEDLIIQADCGEVRYVKLIIKPDKLGLTANDYVYDFGEFLHCELSRSDTTIVLQNPSKSTITIKNIFANYPFGVENISLPILIEANGTFLLNCSIIQATPDTYISTLDIQYFFDDDSTNVNNLKITLTAKILKAEFSVESNVMIFVVPDCENTSEQTLIITNTGDTDITITKECGNTNFKFTNIPILIPPKLESGLVIKFEPGDDYEMGIDSLLIITEQCGIAQTIFVDNYRNYYEYTLSNDSNYISDITICYDSIHYSFSNHLILKGSYSTAPQINRVIIQTNGDESITVNYNSGDILKDTNNIEVNINSQKRANCKGRVLFEIYPCFDTITLSYNLNFDYALLEFENTEITFPQCKIGEIRYKDFQIFNKSNSPIIIDSIEIDNSNFIFIDALPLRLEPKSNNIIRVGFSPIMEGEYLSKMYLFQSVPCDKMYEVILSGNASIQSDTNRVIAIIPKIKSRAGDNIKLPLRITALPPFELSQSNIVGIEIRLTFNPKLFDFSNALSGSVFMTQNPFITIVKNSPGDLTLLIDQINPSLLSNGEYLVIVGETLIGDTLITQVTIDTLIFYSDIEIGYEKIDGEISIIGNCEFQQRLVNIGSEFKLSLQVRFEQLLDIYFSVISNEICCIKLYDISGILVDEILCDYFQIGEHNLKYSLNKFASGLYFIVYNNGSLKKVRQLIYLK